MVGGASTHLLYRISTQKNTSEEEKETTDTSTCNLTRSSDIKQHQSCVTLWNKMSTNEEVIMTVKLWGVDRLHYVLIIILNPIHSLFFSSGQNVVYFFIYETYPHSSV